MNTSKFFKTAMSLCAAGTVGLGATPTARALELTITNQNTNFNDNNVYVMFERVEGGNVSSKTPYSLAQLPKPVKVDRAFGRIFISLGQPLQNVNAPNFNNPTLPDYGVRWDKIEWTIDGSPTQCANLSSADFFSVPLKISNGSTELGWRDHTGNIFNKLKATAGNINADPVIPGNGPSGVVRVISPSTTANPGAYASMSPYIGFMEGKTTPISGDEMGGYDYDARISNGSLVMTGKNRSAGHSMSVDAGQLPIQGLYKCDPQWVVDGQAGWNFSKNDVYCAAMRDVLAGFNLGFVGSSVTNPHTGQPFGNGPSSSWQNTETRLAYAGAQPSQPFYNQYANVIAQASDSYGFPFTDRYVHKPLLNLSGKNLNIIVQGD
ncbi:MAG TPA: beta-1,3-glucanase family protein [Terrimicrobiaceae bacterium]